MKSKLLLAKAAKRAVFIGLMGAASVAVVIAQPTPPTEKVAPAAKMLTFDAFNADSIESAYSAGRFGSDINDYLGVNDWQGLELNGLFMFLGGHSWASQSQAAPDDQSKGLTDHRELQAGFAKTFGIHYIGAYFSGSSVTWAGETKYDKDGNKTEESTRTAPATNVVLFYGNEGIGGLRFDMLIEGIGITDPNDPEYDDNISTYNQNENDKTESWGKDNPRKGLTTALTWGKNLTLASGKKLTPHVTFAVKWSDNKFEKTNAVEATTTTNGGWGLKAGTGMGPIGGDFAVAYMFGKEISGDGKYKEPGTFFLPINVNYANTLEATDKLAFKFKTNLFLQWARMGGTIEANDQETDYGATNYFEVKPTVNLGLRYKFHPKFALYTGAKVDILDFTAASKSKGEDKAGTSGYAKDDWYLSGVSFSNGNPDDRSGNLGLGLVFEPIANLKIGCGMNWLLDQFIKIDLQNTSVEWGNFFQNFNPSLGNDLTGGALKGFTGTIYLTVSYKLQSPGGNGDE